MRTAKLLAAAVTAAGLAFAGIAAAQETMVVYFAKGFYPAEDKAVDELVAKFEKKTGVKVELSRYSPQEMIPKTVAALDSGTPPDVVYGDVFDFQVAGKWAFEGRLEDLSDILTPLKGKFLPNTVETTFMYNDKAKKRAYYAFPVKRQTMHIQYWKDPDNNVNFHTKPIMMTHNATISTASKWLDDSNNEKLTPEQRAEAKKNYNERIATAGFPNKPDGKPMQYRAAVKVGVVFENAKNKKRGKEFAAFLLEDENLTPYVEGALGRWYPVMKTAAERKYWTEDPHRKVVHDQFSAGTVTFEFTTNYKFTILNNEYMCAQD